MRADVKSDKERKERHGGDNRWTGFGNDVHFLLKDYRMQSFLLGSRSGEGAWVDGEHEPG